MKYIKIAIPYVIIGSIVLLIRFFIITPIFVSGSSMYDTLEGKEIMLLYKLGEINRFDIVVADAFEDSLIKRVYGLPGDTISCKNNKIIINGEEIDDIYAFGETKNFPEVTLKDDEYFLMGDNRLVSLDSRRIGPVKKSQIEGTANFVLFPFSKFGNLKK